MPPKRKKGRPAGSKNKKPKLAKTNGLQNLSIKKEDTKFNCNECNVSFDDEVTLNEHKAVCQELLDVSLVKKVSHEYYDCNQCSNKRFKSRKSYVDHILLEHSTAPGSVSCDQCPVRCPNKLTLKKHITDVHERETFECPYCKKSFVRQFHVKRHINQSGCGGEPTTFSCEICTAKFSRKDNLIMHLRVQHIIGIGFICKLCSFGTGKFSKLIIHYQKKHSEKPLRYECDHCGKSTTSRQAITKHMEIHGEKKYSCEVCGYKTFTIEVMRRHVLTHVQDKPFKCDLCGKSYIQSSQLRRHLTKHTGYICSTCSNTFKSHAALIIHQREHLGLKKLHCPVEKCTYAEKEFSNESSLMHHMKQHYEEKSYSCTVCGKQYHSEMYMRRHMATHKLERARRCMYCASARAYVRGEQLVRHIRRHHPTLFRQHLEHVRYVLGCDVNMERVKKSEIECILNVLDAETDRILDSYGTGVLYGGFQEVPEEPNETPTSDLDGPIMSEENLTKNLKLLLTKLIDKDVLECFGWPDEDVDVVLEKVVQQCGAKTADREKWSRVQRLRENTKHLFVYVVEDKNITRMLDTHTIDQIIKHILNQVDNADINEKKQ